MGRTKHGVPWGLVAAGVLIAGCGRPLGQVVQGRCVKYDPVGHTCIVWDENKAQLVRFSLTRAEMGSKPKVGELVSLDHKAQKVSVFDPSTEQVRSLDCTIEQETEPLRPDDPKVKGPDFPQLDSTRHAVTLVCPCPDCARKSSVRLVTFSVLAQEFDSLQRWTRGDVLRIYYVHAGQAHRVMNVTRTDFLEK